MLCLTLALICSPYLRCMFSDISLGIFFFRFECIIYFSFQKCYSDFELQGVLENTLNSKTYQTICSRLQVNIPAHFTCTVHIYVPPSPLEEEGVYCFPNVGRSIGMSVVR